MPKGVYKHKQATWDCELLGELSGATNKSVPSLKSTVQTVCSQMGINLKELHAQSKRQP
jgi:hypothetical protein